MKGFGHRRDFYPRLNTSRCVPLSDPARVGVSEERKIGLSGVQLSRHVLFSEELKSSGQLGHVAAPPSGLMSSLTLCLSRDNQVTRSQAWGRGYSGLPESRRLHASLVSS